MQFERKNLDELSDAEFLQYSRRFLEELEQRQRNGRPEPEADIERRAAPGYFNRAMSAR